MIDPEVIGINNRDLRSFETDIETTHALCADIPAGKTIVSESGYRNASSSPSSTGSASMRC